MLLFSKIMFVSLSHPIYQESLKYNYYNIGHIFLLHLHLLLQLLFLFLSVSRNEDLH